MSTTTPNQRDIDIRIASSMDTYVKNEGDFFVLTGSYSIAAHSQFRWNWIRAKV